MIRLQLFEGSALARYALLVLVLCMTSMVLGDGVLTPAQSVLGAIYGIQVKLPETHTSEPKERVVTVPSRQLERKREVSAMMGTYLGTGWVWSGLDLAWH